MPSPQPPDVSCLLSAVRAFCPPAQRRPAARSSRHSRWLRCSRWPLPTVWPLTPRSAAAAPPVQRSSRRWPPSPSRSCCRCSLGLPRVGTRPSTRRPTRRACCTTSQPLRTRTSVLAPDPVKNCRASIRPSAPCPGRPRHARTQRGSQRRLHGSSLAAARPHRTDPCRSSTGRASAVPRRAHRCIGPTFPPNLRHRCRHHWPCRHHGRRGHLRRRLLHNRRLHGPHQLYRNWSTWRRTTPGRCPVPSPRAVWPPPLLPPWLPR